MKLALQYLKKCSDGAMEKMIGKGGLAVNRGKATVLNQVKHIKWHLNQVLSTMYNADPENIEPIATVVLNNFGLLGLAYGMCLIVEPWTIPDEKTVLETMDGLIRADKKLNTEIWRTKRAERKEKEERLATKIAAKKDEEQTETENPEVPSFDEED